MKWTRAQKNYRNSRCHDPWFQENLQKTGFTDSQKKALCYVMDIRHLLHCSQDEMAKGFFPEYWDFLPSSQDPGAINNVLARAGLSTVPFPKRTPNHFPLTCDEEECRDYLERCNRSMEWYLRQIDKTCHTRFAPNGTARQRRKLNGNVERKSYSHPERAYR